MCRDFDNVAVHVRWPLTTGVAQGRYYCMLFEARPYQVLYLTVELFFVATVMFAVLYSMLSV